VRSAIKLLLLSLAGAAIVSAASEADSQPAATPDFRTFVPDSVSPEAAAILRKFAPMAAASMAHMRPMDTDADLVALHDMGEAAGIKRAEAQAQALGATFVYSQLGGVGVLTTEPKNFADDGTVLIRVHGGGWILGSARSTAGADALMATMTGKRIISVDYTTAPKGKWPLVTDQVIAVYKAVLAKGYRPENIGIFGESAGANIVPGSMLKARDHGLPMPGAMLLLSPCSDMHLNGDSETTLRLADPVLDIGPIWPGLKAYAPLADWNNPYVSPVYADFTKGFPPVLIQVGTKELLLSDSVRLYQAIKMGGREAELEVYEGMPHAFVGYMTGTPEQKEAFAEIGRFWKAHLVTANR
jgi:acetyl esterase/lipase